MLRQHAIHHGAHTGCSPLSAAVDHPAPLRTGAPRYGGGATLSEKPKRKRRYPSASSAESRDQRQRGEESVKCDEPRPWLPQHQPPPYRHTTQATQATSGVRSTNHQPLCPAAWWGMGSPSGPWVQTDAHPADTAAKCAADTASYPSSPRRGSTPSTRYSAHRNSSSRPYHNKSGFVLEIVGTPHTSLPPPPPLPFAMNCQHLWTQGNIVSATDTDSDTHTHTQHSHSTVTVTVVRSTGR
jgi:hypothetical protein